MERQEPRCTLMFTLHFFDSVAMRLAPGAAGNVTMARKAHCALDASGRRVWSALRL